MNMKLENFGSDCIGYTIEGNPKRPEKAHFRVNFPGGDVSIVRATDGANADYWVHVRVDKPGTNNFIPGETEAASICHARLDLLDRSTDEANLGDFNNPNLFHLAVRVKREGIKP